MLDFLFGLGQAVALLTLASGFIVSICCRKWADEARSTKRHISDIHLLAPLSEKEAVLGSLTSVEPKPRHIDAATAHWS